MNITKPEIITLPADQYYEFLSRQNKVEKFVVSTYLAPQFISGEACFYIKRRKRNSKFKKGYYYLAETFLFDEEGNVVYKDNKNMITTRFYQPYAMSSFYYSRVTVFCSNHMRRAFVDVPKEIFDYCGIPKISGKYISSNGCIFDTGIEAFVSNSVSRNNPITADTVLDIYRIERFIKKEL